MAAFVSEVKSTASAGTSGEHPAIPKIKIKFAAYSPDSKDRVKKPKIVKQELKQSNGSGGGGVVSGSKGQCQTCHQCRQSVYSTKTTLDGKFEVKFGKERLKCSRCTRFWCERCLINRYGVVMADMDPHSWLCPFCKKHCNCSVCRKKEGKLATGILTYVAKNAGFQSVSDFLDKGTDDVAKVLQWKSPPVKPKIPVEVKEKTKSPPEKPVSELKVSFKRPIISSRLFTSNVTSSHCQDNAESPLVCHVGGSSYSNGCSFLGNHRSKWRKLDHSSYSIVMKEDDPLIMEIDKCRGTAGWIRNETVVIDPESDFTDIPIPFQASPLPFTSTNLMTAPQTPPMRPARVRKNPGRYSSNEYELELLETNSTGSEENRDSMNHTPIFNYRSPEKSDGMGSSSDSFPVPEPMKCELHREPSTMLSSQLLNDVNVGYGLTRNDGIFHSLDDKSMNVGYGTEHAHKSEPLPLRIEKMEQWKLAATLEEQIALARQLILKAQRDVWRRDKGRGGRGREGAEDERSGNGVRDSVEKKEPSIVDDSPKACKLAGIPPLPLLPPFHLPLSPPLISSFLFVSEFLFTFQEHLGLRRKMTGDDLYNLLSGGRGLADVYKQLLNLMVIESSDLWNELKMSSRQRDLEKVAKKYLQGNGRNGFLPSVEVYQSMEESLVILSHLCHNVLEMGSLDEVLEESRTMVDQLQREHRTRERERGREVREELRNMRENGGSSAEEVESKRKECVGQLEEMRRENEVRKRRREEGKEEVWRGGGGESKVEGGRKVGGGDAGEKWEEEEGEVG